jgi:hypothetical protein
LCEIPGNFPVLNIKLHPMKIRLFLLLNCFFGVFVLSSSCRNEKIEGIIDLTNTADLINGIHISDIAESVTMVPLETLEESLIKYPRRIKFSAKKYFIESGNQVYMFDADGKYLKKIGKIGRGPDEYGAMSDFAVDTEIGIIAILARPPSVVFLYNFEGILVDQINVVETATTIGLSSGNIVIHCDNYSGTSPFSFCIYSMQGELLATRPNYYKFECDFSQGTLTAANEAFFSYNAQKLLVKEFHSDTIFWIDGLDFIPAYILYSGEYRYTPEHRAQQTVYDVRDFLRIVNVFFLDDYLIVRYALLDKRVLLMHNTRTNKNTLIDIIEGIPDDLLTGLVLKEYLPGPENSILNWANALPVLENYRSGNMIGDLPINVKDQLTESSNPVLMQYKLK